MLLSVYTSGYSLVNSLPFLGEEEVDQRAQTQPSLEETAGPPLQVAQLQNHQLESS